MNAPVAADITYYILDMIKEHIPLSNSEVITTKYDASFIFSEQKSCKSNRKLQFSKSGVQFSWRFRKTNLDKYWKFSSKVAQNDEFKNLNLKKMQNPVVSKVLASFGA